MAKERHLRNAPITEAIFDVRVKAPADLDPSQFEPLRSELTKEFPRVEEVKGGQITFDLSAGVAEPPRFQDLGVRGLFFRTEDERLLVQFRTDGFTVNRLRPYSTWNDFHAIGSRLWARYVAHAHPAGVVRIALRYINEIHLPVDLDSFDDFLTAPPRVPDNLPQVVSAFLTRMTIRDEQREIGAHVQQTLRVHTEGQRVSLILDIDAFKEGAWPAGSGQLMAEFEPLHQFKNEIFFGFLTERALEQYS